jgi:uncharacterized protein YbjT (DUF2867 family)
MNKPILVTGATGTIGRDVAKRLSQKGAPVRAGVRDQAKARKQFGPEIALATFDFKDAASFADALDGVEKLFLLPPLMPNQVEVTNGFVDAAKHAGVRHIAKLSAVGADTDPPFTFGKWHAAGEQYIRKSGLVFTFFRPNSFMQNFITYFPPRGGVIYLPRGNGKASFVDTRDIAAIAAQVLTTDGHEGKPIRSRARPSSGLRKSRRFCPKHQAATSDTRTCPSPPHATACSRLDYRSGRWTR